MNSARKVLGILGGLGPMATVYFYEMLTLHTQATHDQEHLDIIISSRASTPDRTAFILGESENDPAGVLRNDVRMLVSAGAGVLAMPCNTAHFFYERISEDIGVPFINMVSAVVDHCASLGVKRVGLMATDGTVRSQYYDKKLAEAGISAVVPGKHSQGKVMNIIYGSVKRGQPADPFEFDSVVRELENEGCERILLSCTELSLVKRERALGSFFIDPLEILAQKCIIACGGTPRGFEELTI